MNKYFFLGFRNFLAISFVGCFLYIALPLHASAQSFPYCSPNDVYLDFKVFEDGKEVSYSNSVISNVNASITLKAKFTVKDSSRCRVDNLQAGFLNNTQSGVRDIGSKSAKILLDSQSNKTKEFSQTVKLQDFQSLSNASVVNQSGEGFAVQAYGWFLDTDLYAKSTNLILRVSSGGGAPSPTSGGGAPSPTSGGGAAPSPTSGGGAPSPTSGGGAPGGGASESSWCGSGKGVLCNPLRSNTLGELMLVIMRGFILLVAAWAVLFIVIGGFRMVVSQGDPEAIKKAKGTITWAIAGVIVSLLAFSLVAIVQNLIGYYGT